MQNEITIKAVKLLKVKDYHGLTITTVERDSKGDEITGPGRNHKAPIHPDLKKALDKLKPHYAVLVRLLPAGEYPGIEDTLKDVVISGYSLGGNDDAPGVTITGHYLNHRGKAVIANTPFELLDPKPGSGYENIEDLNDAIEGIDTRVRKYLSGQERGGQQSLQLNEKGQASGNTYPNDDMAYASKEAMKRVQEDDKPTRKKKAQTADNPGGTD